MRRSVALAQSSLKPIQTSFSKNPFAMPGFSEEGPKEPLSLEEYGKSLFQELEAKLDRGEIDIEDVDDQYEESSSDVAERMAVRSELRRQMLRFAHSERTIEHVPVALRKLLHDYMRSSNFHRSRNESLCTLGFFNPPLSLIRSCTQSTRASITLCSLQ